MAYAKTKWEDRAVEFPRRYKIENNKDGTVTLVPKPGRVIKNGTPIRAEMLNKIENGIDDAHNEKVSNEKFNAHVSNNDAHGLDEVKKSVNCVKTEVNEVKTDVGDKATLKTTDKTNIINAVNEVFQSGVDKKQKMIKAINSKKNISASTNDNWNVLVQKVKDIKQGQGNATKADVLSGKTFTNDDGIKYTGTMPNITTDKIASSITKSGDSLKLKVPKGYYDGSRYIKYTNNDWIESNIKKGVNIFGKIGTYESQLKSSKIELNEECINNDVKVFNVTGIGFKPKQMLIHAYLCVGYRYDTYLNGCSSTSLFLCGGVFEKTSAGMIIYQNKSCASSTLGGNLKLDSYSFNNDSATFSIKQDLEEGSTPAKIYYVYFFG